MSETKEPMSGGRALAIRVTVLVVVLGAGWVVPNHVRAQDKVQKARVEAGRVWYEKYCVPCHGAGGAPGTAVYRANKQPVDLRSYVQRHGGAFPAADWIAAVYSPNPARYSHQGLGDPQARPGCGATSGVRRPGGGSRDR